MSHLLRRTCMTSRPTTVILGALLVTVVVAAPPIAGQRAATESPAPLASFSEPAISPDRSEIAFVSGGDIWTVPAAGGEARLLVSHEADESRPVYSPDGTRLAFISDRTGGGDIYVLTLATGALDAADVRRRPRPAGRLVARRRSGCTSRRPAATSPA